MRKLLCKLGLFSGVYIDHIGTRGFRLVRYDKSGKRYVKFLGDIQYLQPDGSTKGKWDYLRWKLTPFKSQHESRFLACFFSPKKEKVKEITEPINSEVNFELGHPEPYSWR